jgi:hypothetical protein
MQSNAIPFYSCPNEHSILFWRERRKEGEGNDEDEQDASGEW